MTGGVAVYATINNPTMYDAYVLSGKSDAGKVELRDGDKPTKPNITMPAFGSVELRRAAVRAVVGVEGSAEGGRYDQGLTLETDGGVAIAIAAIVK